MYRGVMLSLCCSFYQLGKNCILNTIKFIFFLAACVRSRGFFHLTKMSCSVCDVICHPPTAENRVRLIHVYAVLLLVLRGRHALLLLEDAVEVFATVEAAVVGDSLAAPVRVL